MDASVIRGIFRFCLPDIRPITWYRKLPDSPAFFKNHIFSKVKKNNCEKYWYGIFGQVYSALHSVPTYQWEKLHQKFKQDVVLIWQLIQTKNKLNVQHCYIQSILNNFKVFHNLQFRFYKNAAVKRILG
jgi:hypothetical protein